MFTQRADGQRSPPTDPHRTSHLLLGRLLVVVIASEGTGRVIIDDGAQQLPWLVHSGPHAEAVLVAHEALAVHIEASDLKTHHSALQWAQSAWQSVPHVRRRVASVRAGQLGANVGGGVNGGEARLRTMLAQQTRGPIAPLPRTSVQWLKRPTLPSVLRACACVCTCVCACVCACVCVRVSVDESARLCTCRRTLRPR